MDFERRVQKREATTWHKYAGFEDIEDASIQDFTNEQATTNAMRMMARDAVFYIRTSTQSNFSSEVSKDFEEQQIAVDNMNA